MLTAGLRCSTEKVYGKCKHHQVQLDSPCQNRAITFTKQSSGQICVVIHKDTAPYVVLAGASIIVDLH